MHDVSQPADFLAWAGDIPFLVNWEPADADAGKMTFRVADPDFKTAWAQQPSTLPVRAAAVQHMGLQGFADQYTTMMQEAHEIEQAYEAAVQ